MLPVTCIGKPYPSCSAYIIRVAGGDPSAMELVPMNVPGELCLAGVQVASGYLNRPKATAHAFIRNPFASAADPPAMRRMYRTGDLVRWLPDGSIDFLGRIDSQLKLDGQRVEPSEVEAILIGCEGAGVTQSAVALIDGALVAFVAPLSANVQMLREAASCQLPR